MYISYFDVVPNDVFWLHEPYNENDLNYNSKLQNHLTMNEFTKSYLSFAIQKENIFYQLHLKMSIITDVLHP